MVDDARRTVQKRQVGCRPCLYAQYQASPLAVRNSSGASVVTGFTLRHTPLAAATDGPNRIVRLPALRYLHDLCSISPLAKPRIVNRLSAGQPSRPQVPQGSVARSFRPSLGHRPRRPEWAEHLNGACPKLHEMIKMQ